jgi:hypothetical protein
MGSNGTSSTAGSSASSYASLDAAAPPVDAAGDGLVAETGEGDASFTSCVTTCSSGEVCVEDWLFEGDAGVPLDDAGNCPAGHVMDTFNFSWCILAPTFHCAALPSACTAAPDAAAVDLCTCARSLCGQYPMCNETGRSVLLCEWFVIPG